MPPQWHSLNSNQGPKPRDLPSASEPDEEQVSLLSRPIHVATLLQVLSSLTEVSSASTTLEHRIVSLLFRTRNCFFCPRDNV